MRSPLGGESFELIDLSHARSTPGGPVGRWAPESAMPVQALWHGSAVCNLQDAVADLLAEHELGIGRHAHQDFVELEFAAV